jgi:hypothetical protein
VTTAARQSLSNDEAEPPDEGKTAAFHRTILVTYALCCQRMAPV